MKTLNDWFAKGMSKIEYIHYMQKNKEDMLAIYNDFSLHTEEKESLQKLQEKRLRAIVLTADWCGDAMINLPILMRIADEALIDVRYLIRDENLELMDQYLTNGTARSIPIIIFMNEAGEEVAKWGPRSQQVAQLVGQFQKDLPAKEAPEYEEAFRQFIKKVTVQFKTNSELQTSIKDELIELLSKN